MRADAQQRRGDYTARRARAARIVASEAGARAQCVARMRAHKCAYTTEARRPSRWLAGWLARSDARRRRQQSVRVCLFMANGAFGIRRRRPTGNRCNGP